MDITDREPLNQAMRDLVDIIWKAGGYRFKHEKTTKDSGLLYTYYCCQDSSREEKSVTEGKRDVRRAERFQCESKLKLRPSLEGRQLTVILHHLPHSQYVDIHLTPAVLEFINARVETRTPSEIYQDLLQSRIPGIERVTENQVYYQWQQANAAMWKRDADPFVSATSLLAEREQSYGYNTYVSGRTRGFAIYIRKSMATLASEAKELAVDATYGTNNAGMQLFAVLAELDGTGVPLAYLFLETLPLADGSKNTDRGALTHVLEQFLTPVKAAGFDPTFFGCDKDTSEIAAIQQVWPTTTIQLCFWHAKRAIQTKLKDSTKTNTQSHYSPSDAQNLIPDVEICWGSQPIRRPNGIHRYGECQCRSRAERFDEKGRLEPSIEERQTVMKMFSRDYNMHPSIPDQNGTHRSAETIHRECANEMYTWCRARNYFRLWAYLFVNWYKPGQWELWARAANDKEIPVLKTTMIVESHWRKIKHDYLHRFNRPRIDLVIWILTSRAIPQAIERMEAIRSGDNRKATASWRKFFKKQWKKDQNKGAEPERIQNYHTDPALWTCACDAFLLSRFLICKHLVHCFEPIEDRVSFFSGIRRRRTSPFWVQNQLIIRPEYRKSETTTDLDHTNSDSESVLDPEVLEEDKLVTMEDEAAEEVDVEPFLSSMQSAIDLCREQMAKGNVKFVEAFMAANGMNQIQTLVEEIQRRKNQRTMPKTWSRNKHPATMYYR